MDKNQEAPAKKKGYVKLRHFSRQVALQNLYQIDLKNKNTINAESVTKEFLMQNSCLEDDSISPQELEGKIEDFELWSYASELVKGCLVHWEEINQKISSLAKNWALERMTVIDRSILRIAVYELCYGRDIPSSVAINEAIELGKKYSTVQSGSFINGILDNLVKKEAITAKKNSLEKKPEVKKPD